MQAALRHVQRRGGADRISPAGVLGLLRVVDGAVVLLAGLAAYAGAFGGLAPLGPFEVGGLTLAVVLAAHGFHLMRLYEFGRLTQLLVQARRLLAAWAATVMGLVALAYLTGTSQDAFRLWLGLWFVVGLGGSVAVRLPFKLLVRRWQRGGRLTRTLVVAGAGVHGQRLVEHLRRTADRSVRLVGLFDDRRDHVPDYVGGYPVLGTIDDLLRFARGNPIDLIVVALPWSAEGRLLAWMERLRDLPVEVRVCPDALGFHLVHGGGTQVGGLPPLNVFERPLAGWGSVVKALEDRLLAALTLALVAPLLLLIALLIRLDSPGPALVRRRRYGFDNEAIEVFGFRTARVDAAEPDGGAARRAALSPEPALTRVGRVLRRTGLDELPRLLNVLRGEMSVVGPRPHAVARSRRYARLVNAYLARHRVRPGITGWAQVNGLGDEAAATLDGLERRVQYDLYYVENWSPLFDLRIIARALLVGPARPNARG